MPVSFYLGAEDLNSGPHGCEASALTHWAVSATCVTIFLLSFQMRKQREG